MDLTTFFLGAIAGIVLWNKLNPQVRELICSLFSKGDCLLVEAIQGLGNGCEASCAPRSVSLRRKTLLTRAYDDGKSRKIPHESDEGVREMYDESDDLARYVFDYMRGFVHWVNAIRGGANPPPPNAVTKQQS